MQLGIFGRRKARKQSRGPAVKVVGNNENHRKRQLKKCMDWRREMLLRVEPESSKALRII